MSGEMTSETASPALIECLSSFESVKIDDKAIEAVKTSIQSKVAAISTKDEIRLLIQAIRVMDLTSLGHTDTKATINELCSKALGPLPKPLLKKLQTHFIDGSATNITPAAVCVFPSKILDAKATFHAASNPALPIAAVSGGFPSGQYLLETRVQEVVSSIAIGAREIDIVIDRSLALTQQWSKLYEETNAMISAAKGTHVKVILSTAELKDLEIVHKASMVTMLAGAHFIKTSTGFKDDVASLPVAIVMCRAIKEFYAKHQKKVGFKPAGGIRTHQDALTYMMVVEEELGPDYLTPSLFRLGASSLLGSIIARLTELTKDWPEGA